MIASILPKSVLNFNTNGETVLKKELTFGIVTDVHHSMIPDTMERLETFMVAAEDRNVDFIIQLGDFCHGIRESREFLSLWNQFKKDKYHVLGNHDMDLTSKSTVMEFWGMKKPYYSFIQHGVKFIVLDANFLYVEGVFQDYNKANFYVDDRLRTFVHPEQITWLEQQISNSIEPIIVISHQSLWHYQWGVKNRLEIQQILEKHEDRIICCMNGHNHIDYHHTQNGIDYIEINSMSYQWLGDKYKAKRYSIGDHENFVHLEKVAPYQDPLYAIATIDPSGTLSIEGVRSQWLAPGPAELGVPDPVMGSKYSATISDRKIEAK